MKTIVFDTSVLVSGFVSSHPCHQKSLSWLKLARKGEFVMAVSTHSLAECYAVLTCLPLSPQLSADTAKLLIEENIKKIAKIVSLSANDYWAIIKELSGMGLTGGIAYDAITFQAAKKIKADHILTLNLKDFYRLSESNTDYIFSP